MKYIKLFENLTIEPEIDDYVLMRINLETYYMKDEVNNFINNNIGQIVRIDEDEIRITYHNIPDNIKDWFREHKYTDKIIYTRILNKNKIVAIGKTPEEVKINKVVNKYNL